LSTKYINNPVYLDLKKNELIHDRDIILINRTTRDKKINVYQDKKSRIIFLEKFVRKVKYYEEQKGLSRHKQKSIIYLKNGKSLKTSKIDFKDKKNSEKNNVVGDDLRRYEQFRKYLTNKKICDFGCGYAGFLTLSKKKTKNLYGVELNKKFLDYLKKNKRYINSESHIENFKDNFDLITMFHVLEHLPNQIQTLKKIKRKMNKKGKIIVEVPHSGDILLEKFNIPEFKNFTFWSEHLVLHTKKSLYSFMKKAGFKKIKIVFYQRYGFTNHLNWIWNKKPEGHVQLKKIYNKEIDSKYKKFLEKNNLSDTIIAIAEK
tara:strand:- start:6726 stop:7676 length:951 start_codon:yes stop_codon:yes gene_type:complete